MTLSAQTKLGLTFGQIFSIITTTALVVGFYYSINVRLTEIEAKNRQQDSEIEAVTKTMEQFHSENRQDHNKMADKLDYIIMNVKK